ncbi:MAG: aspartate/glutamate racemase family protein [Bilophila wadsworthia]
MRPGTGGHQQPRVRHQGPESVTERARADLLDEARRLAGNADAIILGCTEIPLALPEKELGGVPLIDATDILARELVRAFAPEKLR